MNRVDMHPEDLLDAAHQGALTPAERARLEQHVLHCASCAVEVALIADVASELAAAPGDAALLDRLVAGAMGEAPPFVRPSFGKAGVSKGVLWAVASALLVGAFGGAAAAMVAMQATREPPPRTVLPATPAAPPVGSPGAGPAHLEPEPVAATPSPPPPDLSEEPTVASETPEEEAAPPAPRRPPSAETLLAMANQARRDHRYDAAVPLYRRLQAAYPASREAALSRVTLGRLLLDGTNDPAGALREFDTYLRQPRGRLLDEEARVGRATALQRLGRRAEERQAWADLLAHHPDTLQAERARQRLLR